MKNKEVIEILLKMDPELEIFHYSKYTGFNDFQGIRLIDKDEQKNLRDEDDEAEITNDIITLCD